MSDHDPSVPPDKSSSVSEKDAAGIPRNPESGLVPTRGPLRSRKLSEEMRDLQAHIAEGPVTLDQIITHLEGRAFLLVVILLALPFMTPIPLPGLSTPFGLVIALIALKMSLGQKPWIPRRLREKQAPAGFFSKVFSFTARILGWLERMMKPRWSFVFPGRWAVQCHSVLMFLSALVLLLPLPIPFTNSFPAWVILLVAAGLAERDGLFVVLGYIVFVLGALYFVFLGEVAQRALHAVLVWLGWA